MKHFGEVTWRHASDPSKDQTFSSKLLTDLCINYSLLENLSLSLGANNIFDIYPDKLDVSSIPVFISPNLDGLELGVVPGICNNNKICEEELGEDYKNCRADCKPLFWTIFWLGVLFFVAFCVYIALQEWYKKHYQSYLFPNKNHLFNLISFSIIGNRLDFAPVQT